MPDYMQSTEMGTPAAIRETVEDEAPDMQAHERPAKRRKKDVSDRTRVSRACDRCKKKKTRCSGRQPCTLCVSVGTGCEFTATYTRGRPPPVLPDIGGGTPVPDGSAQVIGSSSSDVDEAVNQLIGLGVARPTQAFQLSQSEEPLYQQAVNTRHPVSSTDMTHLRLNISGQTDSRAQSSRNSPELPQTDLQGHFVGPSSGVSFLLRVQKKLHQAVTFSQESSIFTFGDAPLPDFNPSFFVLPPYSEAQKLVARYFDFGAATHRFLHRPTVEAWLEEFYGNLGQMTQKNGAQEKTALLFMVFATAKEYSPEARNSGSVDTSARYFQAAEHQLSMETGQIRLTNVQARLCQCLYLLSQSRVNHCWSHFGTTARLIFALGIHRKRRTDPSNNIDHIEQECRKRVFWCAYGLDSYLSAALGRPRTFHDEDIDQELPTLVDDSDLTSQRITTTSGKAQSIMMGAIAHNKLAKIISRILRDIYPIRPPSLQARVALSTKFSEELTSWRKELSRFLDADSFYITLLPPVFQRQRNVLNLAYYHTLILIYRPFLLSNFASLNSRRSHAHGAPTTADIERNVQDCLDAAIHIAAIVNELHEAQQIFRAFWFTHYFAFCAVVVLYVYSIQQRSAPEETYRIYFDVAEKCQTQISSMADKESLVQRYSVVLEELRLEAVKQRQAPRIHQRIQQTQFNDLNDSNQITVGTAIDELGTRDGAVFGEDQHGTTPSSMMAELTGWGEFDSLVTAGMGGLDFGFMGDLDQNDTWNREITNGIGNLVG